MLPSWLPSGAFPLKYTLVMHILFMHSCAGGNKSKEGALAKLSKKPFHICTCPTLSGLSVEVGTHSHEDYTKGYPEPVIVICYHRKHYHTNPSMSTSKTEEFS